MSARRAARHTPATGDRRSDGGDTAAAGGPRSGTGGGGGGGPGAGGWLAAGSRASSRATRSARAASASASPAAAALLLPGPAAAAPGSTASPARRSRAADESASTAAAGRHAMRAWATCQSHLARRGARVGAARQTRRRQPHHPPPLLSLTCPPHDSLCRPRPAGARSPRSRARRRGRRAAARDWRLRGNARRAVGLPRPRRAWWEVKAAPREGGALCGASRARSPRTLFSLAEASSPQEPAAAPSDSSHASQPWSRRSRPRQRAPPRPRLFASPRAPTRAPAGSAARGRRFYSRSVRHGGGPAAARGTAAASKTAADASSGRARADAGAPHPPHPPGRARDHAPRQRVGPAGWHRAGGATGAGQEGEVGARTAAPARPPPHLLPL